MPSLETQVAQAELIFICEVTGSTDKQVQYSEPRKVATWKLVESLRGTPPDSSQTLDQVSELNVLNWVRVNAQLLVISNDARLKDYAVYDINYDLEKAETSGYVILTGGKVVLSKVRELVKLPKPTAYFTLPSREVRETRPGLLVTDEQYDPRYRSLIVPVDHELEKWAIRQLRDPESRHHIVALSALQHFKSSNNTKLVQSFLKSDQNHVIQIDNGTVTVEYHLRKKALEVL